MIEQNKDRTQYRVLTPQHSRNECNHYTCHCKHRVKGGRKERGAGREIGRTITLNCSVCACVSVRVCVRKENESLHVCCMTVKAYPGEDILTNTAGENTKSSAMFHKLTSKTSAKKTNNIKDQDVFLLARWLIQLSCLW